MPRLILADDEPVITRGIQKLIDFSSLGFEVIGEYQDGKEAMDAIIRNVPELVILDISMPSMTGIEILKKIDELNIPTKVIFVSGFQDFEYAKAAVKYGAVDYLLKPVISDELFRAIEKAVLDIDASKPIQRVVDNEEKTLSGACNSLNKTGYIPVIAEIVLEDGSNEQIKKLTRFSFKSFLTEYVESNDLGIVFSKNNDIVIIFNGIERENIPDILRDMGQVARGFMNKELLFIVGDYSEKLSEVSACYDICKRKLGYLYFAGYIPDGIVFVSEEDFDEAKEQKEYSELGEKLINAIVSVNETQFEVTYRKLIWCIYKLAEGKKEDAFFFLCSLVDKIEERVNAIRGVSSQRGMATLLSIARGCKSYTELIEAFNTCLLESMHKVELAAEASDNNAINVAKAYINSHYMEDINLNVMAEVVHMNPYYFSAFFKKSSGVNFKEYISKVRVEKSVQYIVATDKKIYEVATLVGFTDARSFSEAFQRVYNETPNEYRKRIRGAI